MGKGKTVTKVKKERSAKKSSNVDLLRFVGRLADSHLHKMNVNLKFKRSTTASLARTLNELTRHVTLLAESRANKDDTVTISSETIKDALWQLNKNMSETSVKFGCDMVKKFKNFDKNKTKSKKARAAEAEAPAEETPA